MKNFHSISFLLLVAMFASCSLNAQRIENHKGTYTYLNQSYKFKELGDILSENTAAYDMYTKARSSKKLLNGSLIVSGVSFVCAGVVLAGDTDAGTVPLAILFGGLLIFSITTISGIIALFQLDNITFRRKEAIALFNESKALGYNHKLQVLKIGVTANGLGLLFEF